MKYRTNSTSIYEVLPQVTDDVTRKQKNGNSCSIYRHSLRFQNGCSAAANEKRAGFPPKRGAGEATFFQASCASSVLFRKRFQPDVQRQVVSESERVS